MPDKVAEGRPDLTTVVTAPMGQAIAASQPGMRPRARQIQERQVRVTAVAGAPTQRAISGGTWRHLILRHLEAKASLATSELPTPRWRKPETQVPSLRMAQTSAGLTATPGPLGRVATAIATKEMKMNEAFLTEAAEETAWSAVPSTGTSWSQRHRWTSKRPEIQRRRPYTRARETKGLATTSPTAP